MLLAFPGDIGVGNRKWAGYGVKKDQVYSLALQFPSVELYRHTLDGSIFGFIMFEIRKCEMKTVSRVARDSAMRSELAKCNMP
jgi:hypothetical protein